MRSKETVYVVGVVGGTYSQTAVYVSSVVGRQGINLQKTLFEELIVFDLEALTGTVGHDRPGSIIQLVPSVQPIKS